MRFDVFTLFPEVFEPYLDLSILARARQKGLLEVRLHNIRDWATDRHKTVDDEPYGGGGGMVMKPEPIFAAVEDVLGRPPQVPVILLTPQGRPFTQAVAWELAQHPHLALIAGRYEGVDERVRQHLVTDEISIGDFVLTGGELPALVVIDAVARLLPGVLGDPDAPRKDSFSHGLLEHPHYTRPAEYRGWRVPDVLLSGHHAEIARWRRRMALRRTWERRPDLLAHADLSDEERALLAQWEAEARAATAADPDAPRPEDPSPHQEPDA
ncbi:MAG: tRNA (guanosine(37)-N1)-methyltransferase TrmD [Chloroflexi bacterium]|nr:tRNA (guanosine(37)-N1)-methyltransferase TrmD [Chloroflexota bacterium]